MQLLKATTNTTTQPKIKTVKTLKVNVSHRPTENEINHTDKVFSLVKGMYSNKYPRPDHGVLNYYSIAETVYQLNTLPISKKTVNPDLLRGIYEGGISGEHCIKTTPYIPLDIDVKAPDTRKNFKGENLLILKNPLDNNAVFNYLQDILPIVFRTSSGRGIGGFIYVPELQHYKDETQKHKRIAEAIYTDIEKLIYKHTGVIVKLDPAQGAFRQIRKITGQPEPIKLNRKPLSFYYKVSEIVKKSNKGITIYTDNYIKTGEIIQQFNQKKSILDLIDQNPLFSTNTKKNRVYYENSPSKDIGSYSLDKNILWAHSNTVRADLGTLKKKITPFDFVCGLEFNSDYKACIEYLKSLGYKDIKPKRTELQTAENRLKMSLQDADKPDQLIYEFCKRFKLLSIDDKLKSIKSISPSEEYKKYFFEYFGFNDTTLLIYDDQVKTKEYVSESIDQIINLIENHDKILLKSETGSGKTHAFIEPFRKIKKDSRVLLMAPLTIIVDQLQNQGYENISFLTGKSKQDDHKQALNSNFVVATYEQGVKHLAKSSFDYVIVDEAHQLIMANSYKAEIIEQLTEQLQKSKGKLIGLSGTPNRLFESLGFRLVDVKQSKSKKTNVDVIYWNAKPLQIVLNHISKTDTSRRYLFRLNEIDTLYDIKAELVKNKIFKKSEILILHSSPDIKESEQFKHLYMNSEFLESKKVVLTTSIIEEGLSIRDNFTDCVFINNDFEPKAENIKQFFARFRGGKQNQLDFKNRNNYLYLKHTKTEKKRSKYNMLTDYSEKLEILNKDAENLTFDEIKSTYNDFTDTRNFYHGDNSVNEFYLANHVLSQYYKRINRSQFLEHLELNFNIHTNILSQPETPPEAVKGTAKGVKKAKIYEMLANDSNNLLHQVKKYTFDKKLKCDIVVSGYIVENENKYFVKQNIKMIESLIKSHLSLSHLGSDDILQNLTKNGKLKTSVEIQNRIFELKTKKTMKHPKTQRDVENAKKIRSVIVELKKLKEFHLKDFQKLLKQNRINNFNKYTHSTLKNLLNSEAIKYKFDTKLKMYKILTF